MRFGSRTVLLGSGGVFETHHKGHIRDSLELDEVTRDGDLDMVLHFAPRKTTLALTDTQGCVFGRFQSASGLVGFFGCDKVKVLS